MILIIDNKYFFEISHNIESLTKNVKINIDKQTTLNGPVYSHIGGFEEDISFSAKFLSNVKNISLMKEFEERIKLGEPLSISCLDIVWDKQILVESFSIKPSDWVKTNFGQIWYYTKQVDIKGYIISAEVKGDKDE